MTAKQNLPQHLNVTVAIVGTGFSGLGMAIKLKEAGIDDFVVIERGANVGGTWRDNHYPGAACDVPSHLYSFSFEPKTDWSRAFAQQPEIRAYLEHCADKYDIRRHILFNTTVTEAHFDQAAGLWHGRSSNGDTLTAKYIVAGIGALSNPSIPKLKGIEKFKGAAFHSAQWRHDVDLAGKKVVVIGTGASAIQFVPAIQPRVGKLTLMQRTAPWVLPKPDYEFSGVAKSAFARLPITRELYRSFLYARNESQLVAFSINPNLMKLARGMGLHHIRKHIKDEARRAAVTPNYLPGCKRILLSNDYYPALAQPNVDVLNTSVKEVRANSVITSDGQEVECDTIIYGTGFAVHDYLGGMKITNSDGQDVGSLWKDGAEAYNGTVVAGCPNMFMLMGPNTGLGHNSMVYMIESQIRYAVKAISFAQKKNLAYIDVRRGVQDRYNEKLQERLHKSVWETGGCKSWYLNDSGKNSTLWPGFTFEFRARTWFFNPLDYVQVKQGEIKAKKVVPAKAAARA
jgi:cation diffusion facilitator CzcD-associated flavoprotein CzcO